MPELIAPVTAPGQRVAASKKGWAYRLSLNHAGPPAGFPGPRGHRPRRFGFFKPLWPCPICPQNTSETDFADPQGTSKARSWWYTPASGRPPNIVFRRDKIPNAPPAFELTAAALGPSRGTPGRPISHLPRPSTILENPCGEPARKACWLRQPAMVL